MKELRTQAISISIILSLVWQPLHATPAVSSQPVGHSGHSNAKACEVTSAAKADFSRLSPAERDTFHSLEVACLEDLINEGKLTDYQSEPIAKFAEILKSHADSSFKLNAITTLAIGLHRAQVPDYRRYLAKTLDIETLLSDSRLGFGDCSRSIAYCDQLLQTLYALAPIIPSLVVKVATTQQDFVESPRSPTSGILKDVFRFKTKVTLVTAEFYASTVITPDGRTPRWNVPTELRKRIVDGLLNLSNELIDYSGVWSIDDLMSFLPSEANEFVNKIPTGEKSKYLRTFSENLRETLISMGQNVRSLALYSPRLDKKDIRPWLQSIISDTNNVNLGTTYKTLVNFLEVEVRLPFRDEYVAALTSLPNAKQTYAKPVLTYANETLKNVNQFLQTNGDDLGLGKLNRMEKEVASGNFYFHSMYFALNQLLDRLVVAKIASEHFSASAAKGDQEVLQESVYSFEEEWYIHTCLVHVSENRLKETVNLPLSKDSISSEGCGNTLKSSNFDARNFYTTTMNEHLLRRTLVSVGLEVSLLGLTLISAGISTSVVNAVYTKIVAEAAKKGARALTKVLVSRLGARIVHAMLGSAIFTASLKTLTALTGLSPWWTSGKGLWGNLGKPWLIGSAIFFCLPFTASLSSVLSSSLATHLRNQTAAEALGLTVGVGVDTAVFTAIDYIHRVMEHAIDPKKRVLRGDGIEVVLSSALYALAFRGSAILEETGRYSTVFAQVNKLSTNLTRKRN